MTTPRIKMPAKRKISAVHKAADAMDWDEAMRLIDSLKEDARYRDCMLIACGCFLGLRISDLLRLKWADLKESKVTTTEKKTGKERILKVNARLREIADMCYREMEIQDPQEFVFCSRTYGSYSPMSRQMAFKILKECKETYGIRSAEVLSTHSLRKTFGRRVWLQECEKGRGEQALLLLQDVFGHSSMAITKRYLGIRQDEILSVYDSLN